MANETQEAKKTEAKAPKAEKASEVIARDGKGKPKHSVKIKHGTRHDF